MERDGGLLRGDQHGLDAKLVFTFRIQWWFFFHCEENHFGRVESAHRVGYYKIYCTLDLHRLARVNFSRDGPYAVPLG